MSDGGSVRCRYSKEAGRKKTEDGEGHVSWPSLVGRGDGTGGSTDL